MTKSQSKQYSVMKEQMGMHAQADEDVQPALFALDAETLRCSGAWTIHALSVAIQSLSQLKSYQGQVKSLDASQITGLDTAGVVLLQEVAQTVAVTDQRLEVTGLDPAQKNFFDLISAEIPSVQQPLTLPEAPSTLYRLGVWAMKKRAELQSWFAFVGEVVASLARMAFKPTATQLRSTIAVIDDAGFTALPIVALMVFLIGVVLGYQLATQLKLYGADIYIVDISGIAILREFAPLITAVIMAGRTSTAFAALMGTMKVNEEIDVLRTMGITPINRLVLPRILAMLIVMPLLTVWANYFGVLGAMVMAKSMLNVSFIAYLDRFRHAVGITQYMLGLVKAPVFALIISVVGCYQGFKVGNSADSVGRQTTRAAVQAIFLIIIADAAFSILFSWLGI